MKSWAIIVIILFGLGLVSASFNLGTPGYEIEKTYAGGDTLRGWLNIGFTNEPSTNLFTSSNGDKISVLDLIKKNPSFVYTCSPTNCNSDYSATVPQSTKTLALSASQSSIIGFKITGNVSDLYSVKFSIESDATKDCKNQISVDLFNDGKIDITNTKISETACPGSKDYGCFNPTTPFVEAAIDIVPYCQRVELDPAPGYELGAWIKRDASQKTVIMRLYNLSGKDIGYCELPQKSGPSEGEEFCIINYPTEKKESYYVCISADGTIDYKVKGYAKTDGCGFKGIPKSTNNEIGAYSIFAQSKMYNDTGIINLSIEPWTGFSLGEQYKNYIKSKYGNLDCTNGCIVPIKIISGKSQTAKVRDMDVNFDTILFSGLHENEIYTLAESVPTISAINPQKLVLDGIFSVSQQFGIETFRLNLGSTQLFSEQITIKEVPTPSSLTPMSTAAALPTEFIVSVTPSSSNIVSYEWDFGDGKKEPTTSNSIVHSYNSIGTFNLVVSSIDSNQQKGSKAFNISVESPKDYIDTALKEELAKMEKIKSDISGLSQFYQNSIKNSIDFSELENEIKSIQEAYKKTPSTDNETFVDLMNSLIKLNVPEGIVITQSADVVPFTNKDINLDVFQKVDSSEYLGTEEEFAKLVNKWCNKNINGKVSFKEISAAYPGKNEPLIRIFELRINQDGEDIPFLFMKQLEDLKFGGNYDERNISDYVYIPLREKQNIIVFTTTEEVDFSDLPAFIAPTFDKLGVTESEKPEDNSIFIWVIVAFAVILVIVALVYLSLRKQYVNNYEKYGFSSKNDMYNIASFIESGKKKGKSDREIISGLKRAGWSSEQVGYMMKKYSGK